MDAGNTEASQFAEIWHKLTTNQRRFVVAMQEHPTKKEAAESIGVQPQTAYNWNGEVDAAVDFMRNNIALATLGIIQANATKAAMIKAAGLDSGDEKIRQDVATEILDRNLGKPTQRQEHTGEGGGPIQYELTWGDNADPDN
jgi:hypothetical protein